MDRQKRQSIMQFFSKLQDKIHLDKSKEYAIMLFLCLVIWINLYYMHYEVYLSHYTLTTLYSAMLFWWGDVIVTLSLFMLCSLGRRKISFILTYIFLNIFVVANIIYSRFFEQYITLGVLCETSNFQGTWWLNYIPLAFRWTDLLLLLTTLTFFYVLKSLSDKRTYKDGIFLVCTILLSCCVYIIVNTRETYFSLRSYEQIQKWYEEKKNSELDFGDSFQHEFVYDQEHTIVNQGILKTQLYCNIKKRFQDEELSTNDLRAISQYMKNHDDAEGSLSKSCIIKGTPNIIFIIVESYMSIASSTTIQGKEITPNINALTREKGTYSNLNVCSNQGAGESSDAQVSYLTGLLPLESEITVSHIIKNKLIALPELLHNQKGYNTYITVPTGKYYWHQNEVNIKYGIDNIIEAGNNKNKFWCQDKEMFMLVEKCSQKMKSPYINIILTLSMHGSYDCEYPEETKNYSFNFPKSFSKEFCNYLRRCHYTDIQIGKYIQYLKKSGQYENSVIIICSDHQAREINNSECSRDLPLILANTYISTNLFYHGKINQIDLFPTMLDMFGIKSEWRGLGHSLLRPNYNDSITKEERHVSDMIIQGDYFSRTSLK